MSAKNTPTVVTAYGFAKVVNTILAEAGNPLLPQLPVQMFYSYAKKGLIGTDKKPLTAEYAAEWTTAYMARKVEREQGKAAKVEQELNGTDDANDEEQAQETADA
jgi:hypothetical protein